MSLDLSLLARNVLNNIKTTYESEGYSVVLEHMNETTREGWNFHSLLTINSMVILAYREYNYRPHYIQIYEGDYHSLLQLNLSNIHSENGLYSWYLATPRNPESKLVCSKLFGKPVNIPEDVRAAMQYQESFNSDIHNNVTIAKSGLLLAHEDTFEDFLEKFKLLTAEIIKPYLS
jgi:hypothetical protein